MPQAAWAGRDQGILLPSWGCACPHTTAQGAASITRLSQGLIALILASPSFLCAAPAPASDTSCACPHAGKAPLCPLYGPFTSRNSTTRSSQGCGDPGLSIPGQRASRTLSWEQAGARGTARRRRGPGSAPTMAGSRQHPAGRGLTTGAAEPVHMLPFTRTAQAHPSKPLAASTLGCINNQPADGEGFTSCFP